MPMSALFLNLAIPILLATRIQESVVYAIHTDTPPIIDGKLDDSCWQLCTPVTDFFMVEPNPEAPVTQPTYVYVCYDDKKIYFGVHMIESEPDKMQCAVNQRDGPIFRDDAFEVMIDTYYDRRNAYYFMANLLGTKLDGRIIDNGCNLDQTWDAYWETKARMVKNGWQMEIAIPFSELSFPYKDSFTWGINFWRIERPHWETTSWAPVKRFTQVSEYGTLTGLSIKQKVNRFEILPYGAIWYKQDSLNPRGGIDFVYNITSSFIFNATYLPDFAQIEADPLRFNLSYKEGEELYLLEKRPFFNVGSSIIMTPIQLFYTRRIKEILGGAKIYGKIKSTEILGLDVQTKDSKENFSLVRFKQECFKTTTVGILATHKQLADTISQAFGMDLNLPFYQPFLFIFQIATTNNTGMRGDNWAGNIGIEGETGIYRASIYYQRIGPEFWVEQGFVNIYDVNKQTLSGEGWYKFIRNKGIFEWISAGTFFDLTQEIDDRLSRGRTTLWLHFVTDSKWRLGIYGRRWYERYDEEEFVNRNIEFQIESNVGGLTGVSSFFRYGSLYNEPIRLGKIEFIIQPVKSITVWPYFQILRWGETRWRWLINTSISYQITNKAFFRVYLQAESKTGAETDESLALQDFQKLNYNFLLGYEFASRTMLYFVYNQQRTFDPESINNIFVTKLTYSLKF